jgi:hypothetical protein
MKLILFILVISYLSYSQGCSDAGVCSLPAHEDSNQRNYVIGFEQGWGMAKHQVNIFNSNLEFYFDLSEKLTVSGFGPFVNTINELETSSGVGDPIVVLSYRNKLGDNLYEIDLGARLPIGEDNNTISQSGLPMYWQQGLGTFDVIARLGYRLEEWDFLIGAQIPLTENNDNSFIPSSRSEFVNFEPSNQLSRAADLIGRIRYNLYENEKFGVKVGALGVYAIDESSYLGNTNLIIEEPSLINNDRITLQDSDGLVLNIIAGADYSLTEKTKFTLEFGAPIIDRHSEPSGLDRALQLNVGIFYDFGN